MVVFLYGYQDYKVNVLMQQQQQNKINIPTKESISVIQCVFNFETLYLVS